MKKYVVLWSVGKEPNWHVEDKLWPTQHHAEMAAELFLIERPDFNVITSEITIMIPKTESVTA